MIAGVQTPAKATAAVAALLAWAALAAAGCGGGGGDDEPARTQPRPTDAEQAAATVRRQMQAVARGDGGTACGLLTDAALAKANDEVARRGADIGCATAIEQGAPGLPAGALAALRRPDITRVEVRGVRATVRVRLPNGVRALAGGRAGVDLRLRRMGGSWRVDGLPL